MRFVQRRRNAMLQADGRKSQALALAPPSLFAAVNKDVSALMPAPDKTSTSNEGFVTKAPQSSQSNQSYRPALVSITRRIACARQNAGALSEVILSPRIG